MCGRSLADVSSESENMIQRERNTDVRVELTKENEVARKAEKRRITRIVS